MTKTAPHPDFRELVRTFATVGLTSFGGPAGQIALMHRLIVDEKRWVGENDYLHALNVCHLLPGPEAQQLATWIGWRLHGTKGGLAAGLLFLVPGALVILALSILYAFAAGLDWVAALFLGIKAAVLAIVVQALLRIAGRALDTGIKRALAAAAFLALFVFDLPFPLVVLGAATIGFFAMPGTKDGAVARGESGDIAATIRTVLIWLLVWAAPMALIAVWLGPDHVLWQIGLFFSQLAVVTFGGAYAVLAYMAQEAVQGFGWLNAGEMADGLGLAETTPGPLILVTQFVGFLAAFRAPEPFSPIIAGLIGAGLTTWVTFAPCFLYILTVAPWIDRLQQQPRLKGALAAITASVVGVIANLTAWFALHVLFAEVGEIRAGPLRLYVPDGSSLDWRAAVLAFASAILLFALKQSPLRVLALAAVSGYGLSQL